MYLFTTSQISIETIEIVFAFPPIHLLSFGSITIKDDISKFTNHQTVHLYFSYNLLTILENNVKTVNSAYFYGQSQTQVNEESCVLINMNQRRNCANDRPMPVSKVLYCLNIVRREQLPLHRSVNRARTKGNVFV